MTADEPSVQTLYFKDKKITLVVFGVLQIIIGALCALLVPLMILGTMAASIANKDAAQVPSFKMIIPGLVFYVLLAVWFISMGIGSVKTRRWARALILVSSWLWLIIGVLAFAFVLRFLPKMYEQMAQEGKIPEAAVTVMKFAVIGFLSVIYVVIPALFVLFYSGPNVKATCEYRDPQARWTDRCPLPVLAVSIISVFWAASLPCMGTYGWAIPFFGSVLSGAAGAIVMLIFALLLAYTAWGMYKLNIKAWWVILLLIAGWSLSTIITFSKVGLQAFYDRMDIPPQQLETMKQFSTLWGSTMNWFIALWAIAAIVYLVYIRKYFVTMQPQNSAPQL